MPNYIKSILLLVVFLSLITSCDKDFSEINTNPNAPVEVQPDLLLRKVIYDFVDEMSYEGFVAGNLLSQHFTMVDFNLFDRHALSDPQLGGNPWPSIYRNLRDNEILLNQARTKTSQAVYEGPALIMKAYMTAMLTDIYGDVPYSEALRGTEGLTNPSYDSQEDIYQSEKGILRNLEEAILLLENYSSTVALQGDILYQGDLDKWITLAESIRFKYLMRISSRVDVSSQLQAIYEAGNYISHAAQDASFDFAAGLPNSFRMQQLREGDFNLFVMSETSQEILEDLNDPRRLVWFRPAANGDGDFAGLLNGPDASQISISVADFSLAGEIFRENTAALNANLMTSWECHFLIAEAAERGWIAASAEEHYNLGVEQAFEYWNTNLPENYLSSGSAAFASNGSNALEQILTQKWLANSINGYESWIEYRRTGFPQLKAVSASLNNGVYPVRMPYPADESSLNAANNASALAGEGNSVNLKVWWDAD